MREEGEGDRGRKRDNLLSAGFAYVFTLVDSVQYLEVQ